MLVLSRKLGERILVPQCGLTVTIIAVKGKAVQVGIEAPADLAVLREELVGQQTWLRTANPVEGGKPP